MQTENRLLYVSLGANTGRRAESIGRAVAMMEEEIGKCTACSRLYETEPQGFASPNKFLNAAAAFSTVLSASEILQITQDIERRLGRTMCCVICRISEAESTVLKAAAALRNRWGEAKPCGSVS